MSEKLTHFDETGRAAMVDVGDKVATKRKAIARGFVSMKAETLKLIKTNSNSKGDVISVAELAGIMGAKRTSDLIPLCHPLPLTKVSVRIQIDELDSGLSVETEAKTKGQTGVEMEALTAVSVACLTIYDMLKSVDREMCIEDICLVEKSGGKSGVWKREDIK